MTLDDLIQQRTRLAPDHAMRRAKELSEKAARISYKAIPVTEAECAAAEPLVELNEDQFTGWKLAQSLVGNQTAQVCLDEIQTYQVND